MKTFLLKHVFTTASQDITLLEIIKNKQILLVTTKQSLYLFDYQEMVQIYQTFLIDLEQIAFLEKYQPKDNPNEIIVFLSGVRDNLIVLVFDLSKKFELTQKIFEY